MSFPSHSEYLFPLLHNHLLDVEECHYEGKAPPTFDCRANANAGDRLDTAKLNKHRSLRLLGCLNDFGWLRAQILGWFRNLRGHMV